MSERKYDAEPHPHTIPEKEERQPSQKDKAAAEREVTEEPAKKPPRSREREVGGRPREPEREREKD